MNKHWQLRDEWYRIFHNWPVLAALFLLGGLLGWAAGWIWPSYSRASREVYVALNPYRAYSDAQFLALAKPRYSNIDNYHYWQMNQLETAILRSDLLRAALEKLRTQDPYWNNIDADGLRAMLDSEWRTAGAWRLSVFHGDGRRARQALEAWSEQIMTVIPQAVSAARETFVLDQQLGEANRDLTAARLRQTTLLQAEAGLQAWREQAAGLPADQSLSPKARWQVFSLSTAHALDTPAWQALLDAQPKPDAPANEYLSWSEQVLAEVRAELAALPEQIQVQEIQAQDLQARYDAAASASLSLSPNLAVESIGAVQVEKMRPTATLALVGAFLGMLAGLLLQLVRITRRGVSPAPGMAGESTGG